MTNDIVRQDGKAKAMALAVPLRGIEDLMYLGSVLAASGFFKNTQGDAQAVAKIIAGMELGIAPVASLRGLYIVEGQISLAYPLIGALIKGSGKYDYRIREKTAESCVVEFFESGESVGFERLTMKQAQDRGLSKQRDGRTKEPWAKFPENMLLSKCLSNGAKAYASEVFYGSVYTPDELGAEVDGVTGAVVQVELEALPGVELATCEGCGGLIGDFTDEQGKTMPAAKIEEGTRKKYGKALCWDCAQAAKAESARIEAAIKESFPPIHLTAEEAAAQEEPAKESSKSKALATARRNCKIAIQHAATLVLESPVAYTDTLTFSQLTQLTDSLVGTIKDAISNVAMMDEEIPDHEIPKDTTTLEEWMEFVAAWDLLDAIKADVKDVGEEWEMSGEELTAEVPN